MRKHRNNIKKPVSLIIITILLLTASQALLSQTQPNTNTPSIQTDKTKYALKEKVFVNVNVPDINEYKLYYEYQGFTQRYIGDYTNFNFTPRGIGTHYLVLRDKAHNEIIRHSFEVTETQEPTTPETPTEPILGLRPIKKIFKQKEDAEFELSYEVKKDTKPLGRLRQRGVWQTPREKIIAELYDSEGKKIDVIPEYERLEDGKFNIKIPKKRSFRAGTYTLRVELTREGTTSVEEESFLWGVLAINTHKSIYLPNETSFIGIAVLDDTGRMVCDANVTLRITDPNGVVTVLSTSNNTILVSPECSVYGVTNLPDYYAYYRVGGEGTYTMKLTAKTRDGERSITDAFEVRKHVNFDVERDGPTRIYPPAKYQMNFKIKTNKDYEGEIREHVPSSFAITPEKDITVTTSGDTKTLTWTKKFRAGETYNLAYEFDAPDTSPYLFTLGPLEIGNWEESREWMVASDAPITDVWIPTNAVHSDSSDVTTSVSASDGDVVSVDKNEFVTVNSWNDSLPAYRLVQQVIAKVEVTAAASGAVINIQTNNSGSFSTCGSCSSPQNYVGIVTCNLTGNCSIDTNSELSGLYLRVLDTDGDGKGPSSSSVDYIWLEVTWETETVSPTASLGTNPTPGYVDTDGDGSVTFDLKCEDNIEVNTLQLWGNWTGTWEAQSTNTNPGNDTWWNVTVSGIPEGTWKWGAYCNDSAGNEDWSDSNRTFSVNLGPKVKDVGVTPQKARNGTTINITANITDSDGVSLAKAMVYYPNGTHWQNLTMTSAGDIYYNDTLTVSFYPPGTYNVTIWSNDSLGIVNSTETTWFAPILNLSDEQDIVIDGSFTDWSTAGIPVISDAVGDAGSGGGGLDNELLITGLNNDPGNITIFSYDNDSSTYVAIWSTDTPDISDPGTDSGIAGGELGDVNHDGVNDFVIVRYNGSYLLEVWTFNSSNSEWYRLWAKSFSSLIYLNDVGDFDGDNKDEIYITNREANPEAYEIWGNDTVGATTFGLESTVKTFLVITYFRAAGDLDGDGVPELIVGPQAGGSNFEIYEYNGSDYEWQANITIPNAGGGSTASMTVDDMECTHDVNNDTNVDCVFCGNSNAVHVLTYTGSAYTIEFNSTEGGEYSQTCSAADITNDGYADFYDVNLDGVRVWSYQSGSYLSIWNSSSQNSNADEGASFAGDSDNDGKGEFLAGDRGTGVRMFENNSEGATTFTNSFTWSTTTNGQHIIIGDLDSDATGSGGGGDFDITNYSLAHNSTYLFARISVNGSVDLSDGTKYYAVYISYDSSTGNTTAPDSGATLPFPFDSMIKINGSSCDVFNSSGSKIGTCTKDNNSNTLEVRANFSALGVENGNQTLNITFETGTSGTRYDLAPDTNSFLVFEAKDITGGTTVVTITNVSINTRYPRNGTAVNISANVTSTTVGGVSVDTVIARIIYPNGTSYVNITLGNGGSGDIYYNDTWTVNFLPAGQYNFTVWANNTNGVSETSDTYSFTPLLNLSDEQDIVIDGSFTDSSTAGIPVISDAVGDAGTGGGGLDNELLIVNQGVPGNISIYAFNQTGSGVYDVVWSVYDADVTYISPGSVEMGDLNNDGVNEFVISLNDSSGWSVHVYSFNSSSSSWYLLDDVDMAGSGGHEAYQSRVGKIADFDEDGFNEFVVYNPEVDKILVYGNGSVGGEVFALEYNVSDCGGTQYFPGVGDLNGNGVVELIFKCGVGSPNEVWEWNGSGFENIANFSEFQAANDDVDCGDLDRDGVVECVFCGNGKASFVVDYNGTGYYVNFTTPLATDFIQSCSVGDVTNDGWDDFFDAGEDGLRVFSFNASSNSYYSVWNSSFGMTYPVSLGGTFAGDADNDGRDEMLYSDVDYDEPRMYENDSVNATSFSYTFSFEPSGSDYSNMLIGDLDSDGGSGGGDNFDIANYSLAHNSTYLFARIAVNGSIDLSDGTKYYRMFISADDSAGNETSPEGDSLPFKYDYRVQVNGSSCYVYNYSDYSNNISSCLFNYSGGEMEIAVNLSVINLSAGDNANITFETGDDSGSYDFAPDYNSFLSYEIPSGAGPPAGPVQVDSCRELDSPNTIYELNRSVNSTGTCFTVLANNVTLDCKGYEVNHSTSSPGYGINNTGGYNLTKVKNCIIRGSSGVNQYYAVYLSNAQNATIENNTILIATRDSYGIYLYGSGNANLTNNRINSSSSQSLVVEGTDISHFNHTIDTTNLAEGKPINYTFNAQDKVYSNLDWNNSYGQWICAWCRNITIENVTAGRDGINLFNTTGSSIINATVTTETGYGVFLSYSDNNLIANSTIETRTGWGLHALYIQESNNNNITGNTIKTFGDNYADCIRISENSQRNIIKRNSIHTESNHAQCVWLGGTLNIVDSNNLTANCYSECGGVYTYKGSNSNITNNFINITGSNSPYGYGIHFYHDGGGFLAVNNTVYSQGYAVKDHNANSNTIRDSVLNPYSSNSIYVSGSSKSRELNLTNCTFNKSGVDFEAGTLGRINVFWYLDVYVNDTAGNPVDSANVTAWDKNNNQAFTDLTNSSGWVSRKTLREYWQNETYSQYYTNYTVNASKSGYDNESREVNLTTNKVIYFTLSESTPPIVNINVSLNNTQISDSTPTISFNFTDSQSATASCVLYFNSTSKASNTSTLNNTQTWLTASTTSSGRYDVWVNCTDTSGNEGKSGVLNITISGGNNPPVVNNVSSVPAQTPNPEAVKVVRINFTVTDTDGVSDLNHSSAKVVVNKSGVVRSGNCSNNTVDSDTVMYNCSVPMQYYDGAGTWSINVSVMDYSQASAFNATTVFTYNDLLYIQVSPVVFGFGDFYPGPGYHAAGSNPLLIDNMGNVNLTQINITAYNLVNGSYTLGVSNITVNVSDAPGVSLQDSSPVIIPGANVSVDVGGVDANESLYFFITIPNIPPLKYVSSTDWVVSASD